MTTGPFASTGRDALIVDALRTPIGRSHLERGWFRDVHPNVMLGAVYAAHHSQLSRAGTLPRSVKILVEGQVPMDVVTWQPAAPGIWRVTMASPPANALSGPLLDGLHAALDAAEAAGDVKVLVVSSAVDRFFAAGADIKHMAAIDAASFTAYGDRMRAVNDRLTAAPFLSVAAVDGLALGGGLELAMAATMRVSGPRARYGLPEVKLGLIPGAGGTQRLPRLVGRGRALDIMLTARQVPAMDAASDLPLGTGLDYEAERVQALFEHGEAAEGIAAFTEKRSPRFA